MSTVASAPATTTAAPAAPTKKVSKKTAKAAEPVAEAAASVDASAAPAAPAKKATRKSAKAAEPVAETAPAPAAATETPVAEDSSAASAAPAKRKTLITREDVEASNAATEGGFNALLQTIKAKNIQGITKTVESLRKQVMKANQEAIKAIEHAKKNGRRKTSTGNKKPSGLQSPIMLSPEYATVIGVDASQPTTRQEAVDKLYAYMVANNLKDPSNGRRVNPDAKILSLLHGWDGTAAINYITVRRYISHHFTPSKPEPVATA